MTFPDVEAMVKAFLDPQITPVKVHQRVPANRPEVFVRAWRTGGAAANRVLDRPLVTVQAWAKTTTAAADLARTCREALLSESTAMPLVRSVEEVTGPYYDPDPDSGAERYSFTVQLSVRAHR